MATAPPQPAPSWRLPLAIALVSAGALAYQLLLMRWLAIAHWHPFAAMIISLALLGHGASGTWLGLCVARARARFALWFPASALLFAATATAVPLLARAVPFNGLELAWNLHQLLWLALLYLLLATPFFFAAACFGLAFARYGAGIPRLYAADLMGAGVGALLGLALMWLPLEHALPLAATAGVLAAVLQAPGHAVRVIALGLALLLAIAATTRVLAPPVNEYKGLAKALLMPQARVLAQRDSPYGRLSVVESVQVPLRHQPGLSLANTREPAPQLGVFVDGDGLSVITHRASPRALGYLDHTLSALPYRLTRRPRVLLLGLGGGTQVRQALRQGARRVEVVEADPVRRALVCAQFAHYAGGLCQDPRVHVHAGAPRDFARGTRARFDVVAFGSEDSLAGSSAGVQAASEQYALTVEALRDYLRVLVPGGVLVIERYSKQPPRDELKLWAALVAALRASGHVAPERQLLALRNWDASLLLAASAPLTPTQRAAARAFATQQGFELVHAPDAPGPATPGDTLALGLRAALSPQAGAFVRDYKFAIAPATDDAPYFAHFFRWRSLPELWRLREAGAAVLLDSGYLLLVAALLQALPLALLLVLLPLLRRRVACAGGDGAPAAGVLDASDAGECVPGESVHDESTRDEFARGEVARKQSVPDESVPDESVPDESVPEETVLDESVLNESVLAMTRTRDDATPLPRLRVATYFIALGLAFFFIEIACLSRLTLLVGQPLPAAAVGLGGFLLFAGLGSRLTQAAWARSPRAVPLAVALVALGLAWHLAVVALARDAAPRASRSARALAGLASVAPLALAMGMPFPLGLARLARQAPDAVPWAWALNGCASVVAAIAALLLAMAVGLRATLWVAWALYLLAAWVWPMRPATAGDAALSTGRPDRRPATSARDAPGAARG